jgi:hypothetical protein
VLEDVELAGGDDKHIVFARPLLQYLDPFGGGIGLKVVGEELHILAAQIPEHVGALKHVGNLGNIAAAAAELFETIK